MIANTIDTVLFSPSNIYLSIDLDLDVPLMNAAEVEACLDFHSKSDDFFPYFNVFSVIAMNGWKDPQLPELDILIEHCKSHYHRILTPLMILRFGTENIPQPVIDRVNKYVDMISNKTISAHNKRILFDDEDEIVDIKYGFDFTPDRYHTSDTAKNCYHARHIMLNNLTRVFEYIAHWCIKWLQHTTKKLQKNAIRDFKKYNSANSVEYNYSHCVQLLARVTLAAYEFGVKIPVPEDLINTSPFRMSMAIVEHSVILNNFSQTGDPVTKIMQSWGVDIQSLTQEEFDIIANNWDIQLHDEMSIIGIPYVHNSKLPPKFRQVGKHNPLERELSDGRAHKNTLFWYAHGVSLLPDAHLYTQCIARALCCSWRVTDRWGRPRGAFDSFVMLSNRMKFNSDDIIGSYYNINKTHAMWAFEYFNELYIRGLRIGPKCEKFILMSQIKRLNISDQQRIYLDALISSMRERGAFNVKEG